MRHIACWIIAVSVLLISDVGSVRGDEPRVPPGARQADLHNPFSPRHVDFRPNGLARRNNSGHNHHHHNSGGSGGVVFYPYYPVYGGYYPRYYGGGYYPPYYGGGYYGSGYGGGYGYQQPTNIYNTTNVNINIAPPANQPAANPDPAAGDPVPGVVNRGALPESNARARELSSRFIGFGDNQFAAGDYVDAQLRYRKAIKAAPDFAEAYFRRGQAMIALGQYDLAAEAIKQGLRLKPTWAIMGNRLDDLYGDNQDAKEEHLAALLREIDAQPLNADLEFLAAWQMYFGGQRAGSQKHFQQAAQMAGDHRHLDGFLAVFEPQQAQQLPREQAKVEAAAELDRPAPMLPPDPLRLGAEF